MSHLLPGDVVATRYRLDRLIGEGGMGVVWAATHVVTGGGVALKVLKLTSVEAIRRFLREARIAGTLRHPNVVQVQDVLQLDDGSPVMVMELLDGESLYDKLRREGRVPLAELCRLLLPVVSAVGTAHAHGIIHRDLKPENVFLSGDRARPEVKVLDFGIAKVTALESAAAETAGLTKTGSVIGTPYYMAPEQVFGERDIDHRADVWSLGVMLYECLAGRRPVDGENVGQIFKVIAMNQIVPIEAVVPDLTPEIAQLVDRMLARERARRPGDLREVFEALAVFSDAEVAPFGAPIRGSAGVSAPPPRLVSVPPEPADSAAGSAALAATMPSQPVLRTLGGADTVQAAVIPEEAARPSKRGRWLVAGAILVASAFGAVGSAMMRREPAPAVATAAPAPIPKSVGTSLASASTSGGAPSASSAAASIGKPTIKTVKSPAVAASAPSAATVSKKSAEPTAPSTLPGGIHGNSPY